MCSSTLCRLIMSLSCGSKTGASTSSKYLSPCRTVGLKRKCRSSESPLSRNPGTYSLSPCTSWSPPQSSPATPCRPSKTLKVTSKVSSDENVTIKETDNTIVDNELFLNLVSSINEKESKIIELQTEDNILRKGKLENLRKSTEKWRNTCQEVIQDLFEEIKSRGGIVSLLDIINGHNIPPDKIGFDINTLDFV